MASTPESRNDSYKHQWARYVARQSLKKDAEAAKKLVKELGIELTDTGRAIEEVGIGGFLQKIEEKTGLGPVPPSDEPKFKVGIVGAGVAGLFTAMVFDWLNKEVNETMEKESEKLKIDYDIVEAAGENRLGGRLYTHHFSEEKHDYYDVGAMRFPNNAVMKRTFRLFELLKLNKETGLIPYYMKDYTGNCPFYFNDRQQKGDWWKSSDPDPFKLNKNSTLPDDQQIKPCVLKSDPGEVVSTALEGFIKETKLRFAVYNALKDDDPKKATAHDALWTLLMKADQMSVRQFLSSDTNSGGIPNGPNYNYNTIEWLETYTYGTGWYDQSLTECVLEELDFGTPEHQNPNKYWYCIFGGAQRIAKLMAGKIEKKVQYHSQVEAIDCHPSQRLLKENKDKYVPMTLKVKQTYPEAKATFERSRDYFAVFNSTTLGALQRMNLKNAGLLWGAKQAIRSLGYGASCKVAIKFKSAWWQQAPFNITEGGVARTDLPLRVCVYPSYNVKALNPTTWDPAKPAVLLCSYTWGQDAQRLASLISADTPNNEGELIKTLLHDLALLHAEEGKYEEVVELLYREYETHHAWDWYKDQNMSGAFAYFGPGQFSHMWEEITKPNAGGQLYLVGEASSSHHAWVVGALESVIRAVYLMFEGLSNQKPECVAYQKAMELLTKTHAGDDDKNADPEKLPTGLPFYPLPEEMPNRQAGVSKDEKMTDNPVEAGKDVHLNHASATAALSLIESYAQLKYEQEVTSRTA